MYSVELDCLEIEDTTESNISAYVLDLLLNFALSFVTNVRISIFKLQTFRF